MQAELDNLQENGTWILVQRSTDKKVLTNRWVLTTKINGEGEITKYKARLVAHGLFKERNRFRRSLCTSSKIRNNLYVTRSSDKRKNARTRKKKSNYTIGFTK